MRRMAPAPYPITFGLVARVRVPVHCRGYWVRDRKDKGGRGHCVEVDVILGDLDWAPTDFPSRYMRAHKDNPKAPRLPLDPKRQNRPVLVHEGMRWPDALPALMEEHKAMSGKDDRVLYRPMGHYDLIVTGEHEVWISVGCTGIYEDHAVEDFCVYLDGKREQPEISNYLSQDIMQELVDEFCEAQRDCAKPYVKRGEEDVAHH